jgi:3-oxoacyl-[acyl-carrier protein] reductase
LTVYINGVKLCANRDKNRLNQRADCLSSFYRKGLLVMTTCVWRHIYRIQEKVVLVTGAGGTGAEQGGTIALAFASEGADVTAEDINLEAAEKTAEEVRKLGRQSIAIQADVAHEDEVNTMIDMVIQKFGGIDILVNNAGYGYPILVEDMTAEEWHRTIAVNLDGPFFCSRAVIPSMKSRGGGRIITIA